MEETTQPKVKSIAIKWGAISGLISIVLLLVIDFAGLMGNKAVSWIGSVVFAVLLVLAHKQYKDSGDGYMSYGKGLGIGTFIACISSVISSLFYYIYISFINTEYIEIIKDNQIMELEKSGMSDREINQMMEILEMFMSPIATSIFILLGGVMIFFIISLLVTIFTKNQDPEAVI